MAGYEFGFDRAIESGAVTFLNLMTDRGKQTIANFGREAGFTGRLVGAVRDNGVDRVVIDSTMLLDYSLDEGAEWLTSFLSELKQLDATIVLISEMIDPPPSYADEHYLAHDVVFFHNFMDGGGMTRGVQVIKMRGTAVDTDIHHIEFDSGGLTVAPGQKVET